MIPFEKTKPTELQLATVLRIKRLQELDSLKTEEEKLKDSEKLIEDWLKD